MLVSFTVANFRSFKEAQTLSMEADARIKDLGKDNCYTLANKKLLKSAVLFGPNESGKSNLLKALVVMRDLVLHSGRFLSGDTIPEIESFKLHSKNIHLPTVFDVTFIQENMTNVATHYRYGFAATSTTILEEWLYENDTAIIERSNYSPKQSGEHRYKWLVPNTMDSSFIKKTGDNQLFITKTAEDQAKLIIPVINWFKKLVMLASGESFDISDTGNACLFPDKKERIIQFLKAVGSDIDDVEVIIVPTPDDEKYPLKRTLRFIHTTTDTEAPVSFSPSHESDGTFRLFEMISPWLDMLEKGKIFVIDELDNSLHPSLVRALIEQIHHHNPNNAQLLFSTHDISQMDETLFRPDQLWLVEKQRETKSSQLYALSHIEGKPKKEPLSEGYMMGRYGALPVIGSGE